MSARTWELVDEALERGEAPVISLSPATRVLKPKNPVGRPRVRKPGAKEFEHYTSFTPAGHRMVCRAIGCERRLKRNQVLVCSEQCANALRQSCELYLSILNGEIPPEDLPSYMRTNRLRRGTKATL